MKSLKIVSSFLAVALLAIGFSAFTTKSFKATAFARVCYKYSPPNHGTAPNFFRLKDVRKNQTGTIDETEFKTENLWTSITAPTSGNPDESNCNTGNFFCTICFDNPPRSLTTALADAWTYFAAHSPGFTHGTDIGTLVGGGTGELTIYLKSTDANF